MKKITFLTLMFFGCLVAFAQQPEVVLNDWDGNKYPNYESNLWSNPNCWCIWNAKVANPATDGINASDSCMYYPAHNWLDQTWWYYQAGMFGFKKLPTSYLQDHKYVYLEYLVGDDVSNSGVLDAGRSPVGDTIQIQLQFNGASSDARLLTDVLHEIIITEDNLNTWKAVTLEIPDTVRNSDYTILAIFTGINKAEEMEIEFYYDNVGLTNTAVEEAPTEVVLNDWDGNKYPNYESNLWSNPNCWCIWNAKVANPATDGINASDSSMYYPAHNWLDQTWWYYQAGMFGFKKLPTSYLQDHKYVYLEYLVGDDVSNSGVLDAGRSPVGDTIQIQLQFNGASSDAKLLTDVLHEIIITEDNLNTWKAVTLEIPDAVRNSDYTILAIFTGVNKAEEMEIEFYYDNVKLTNTAVEEAPTEIVLNDWDGNKYPNYESNLWSNPNCWCVWNATVANPASDGINASDSSMYYPAHNWLDQTWWYYQAGMFGFKQLPSSYLQDHKYVYLDYLVGDDVSNAGVVDAGRSPVGDTIQIKLQFNGASSDDKLLTDVLHEIIIAEDNLNTWKAVTLEIPDAVRNSDYTILAIFTGINKAEEMEIEFYYDNVKLTNTAVEDDVPTGIVTVPVKKDFNVFMSGNICNIRMDEPTKLKSVQFYNIAGSLIYQKPINYEARDFKIPLNLHSGVYIIRINSDKQSYAKKFYKR